MEIETAVAILKKHNQWRKGVIDEIPYSPKELGRAISIAIVELDKITNKYGALTQP